VDGVIPGTVFTSISSNFRTRNINNYYSFLLILYIAHIQRVTYLPTTHVNKCIDARKPFQTQSVCHDLNTLLTPLQCILAASVCQKTQYEYRDDVGTSGDRIVNTTWMLFH
jgi:hypothetical protein